MYIVEILLVVVCVFALFGLWIRVRKNTNPKHLLEKTLEKNGLTAPMFISVNEVDWRISCGKAIMKGHTVRFVTVPNDDGMLVLVTDFLGHNEVKFVVALQ